MPVTVASFREALPEFQDTSDALIQSHITMAETRTDAAIFGGLHDMAVLYRAADSLASSPFGRNARLQGQRNIYRDVLDEIEASAPAAGPWVPGVRT